LLGVVNLDVARRQRDPTEDARDFPYSTHTFARCSSNARPLRWCTLRRWLLSRRRPAPRSHHPAPHAGACTRGQVALRAAPRPSPRPRRRRPQQGEADLCLRLYDAVACAVAVQRGMAERNVSQQLLFLPLFLAEFSTLSLLTCCLRYGYTILAEITQTTPNIARSTDLPVNSRAIVAEAELKFPVRIVIKCHRAASACVTCR
jgi:hypothetical protein